MEERIEQPQERQEPVPKNKGNGEHTEVRKAEMAKNKVLTKQYMKWLSGQI